MPDTQRRELIGTDDFQKRLLNCEESHMVSPKMSEYIEMVETYLLIREKKVFEKISFNDVPLKI